MILLIVGFLTVFLGFFAFFRAASALRLLLRLPPFLPASRTVISFLLIAGSFLQQSGWLCQQVVNMDGLFP